MNTKLVALALICVVAGVALAYAVNEYILSDHITGTAEDYVLILNVNSTSPWMVGETLNFTGTLTSDTYWFPNVNVTLWMNSTYTGQSDFTDDNGFYTILYTIPSKGYYDFYANATIT